MLRDVFVYGAAGREFGRHFRLDVASPREAITALLVLRPGIRQRLRVGNWRVIVGRPHIANGVDALDMRLGAQALHLVPTTRPRGGDDGVGKVVAGVALIGAAIVTAGLAAPAFAGFAGSMAASTGFLGITYGNIAMFGASMVLGGVAQLLSTPTQKQQVDQPMAKVSEADRPSFLFNGVVNNTQQGGPVPLVFGTHLTGSIVIGSGLNAEDIA
jgi:predicted phage tail protein